eukprot:m.92891 g.92891  ORF g.92891 m.92891 type:complete len:491 (-) comp13369_c0_seq1:109-1581(-)
MDIAKHLPKNNGSYIDGQFIPLREGQETLTILDPRDSSVLTKVAVASKDDVDAAVAAAKKGLKLWAAVPALEKSRLLLRLADLIEENLESFAILESLNLGKPVASARGDIGAALQTYRYFAGWTDKITGDTFVPGDGGSGDGWFKCTTLNPVGVVGHLVPWNYPIVELAKYIAPCLMAGAVSVYKTNEYTPLTVLKTMELFDQVGFPPGVLNVIHGGVSVGEMITRHMDIQKVIFTGSVRAGRAIRIAAAESNLKDVCLELGGKSAHIVCADADLDKAASNVLLGFTEMMGQCCCAGTRILVHSSIHDKLLEKVVALAKNLVIGDPLDPKTQQGPLCNPTQLSRVLRYLEIGKKECTLVTGGHQIGDSGLFVQPTIFADVKPDSTIANEEIFGPVAAFMKFGTVEEAVEIANNSDYALAAGIWTKSLDNALSMAKALDAGTVWVNGMMMTWGYNTPFGGGKLTGGGRTNGKEGLMHYLVPKTISISHLTL